MIRTFTIQRTADYEAGVEGYPYTPKELASAKYVVSLNNGDWHLCQTVEAVKQLIDDELWLAGFDDEED